MFGYDILGVDRIITLLTDIRTELRMLRLTNIKEYHRMSASMDKLIAAVNADTAADSSVVVLVQGLAAMVADLKNQIANLPQEDVAKIEELATAIQANADAVAAAVVANTPQA